MSTDVSAVLDIDDDRLHACNGMNFDFGCVECTLSFLVFSSDFSSLQIESSLSESSFFKMHSSVFAPELCTPLLNPVSKSIYTLGLSQISLMTFALAFDVSKEKIVIAGLWSLVFGWILSLLFTPAFFIDDIKRETHGLPLPTKDDNR